MSLFKGKLKARILLHDDFLFFVFVKCTLELTLIVLVVQILNTLPLETLTDKLICMDLLYMSYYMSYSP